MGWSTHEKCCNLLERKLIHLFENYRPTLPGGGGTPHFWGRDVQHGLPKRGSKEHFFFVFVKVRSKELKFLNILGAYELKSRPNLGCRAESSCNF